MRVARLFGGLPGFLAERFAPTGTGAREIRSFQRRLFAALAVRAALRFSAAWIMIWAGGVVALRAAFLADRRLLLWGALGLLVAAAAAVIVAVRRLPSARAVRAVLDGRGRLGGLLMAAGETDAGEWAGRRVAIPRPRVTWRAGRQWLVLGAAVAFLGAAFVAPDRYLPAGPQLALQVDGEVKSLADKIQVLEEEKVLAPEKARALRRDVERIGQEALGRDPASTMESLDHLEQALGKAATEAAEAAVKQAEMAGGVEKLAEALDKAQGEIGAHALGAAMKELAELVDRAAGEDLSLAESLPAALKDACRQGALSAEQLRALCRCLGECRECQRARIARLVRARLIDPETLVRCDEAAECDVAALCEALGSCPALRAAAEGLPGRGGVSRGRADAAMTWTQGAEKQGAAFKEKVLPPAALASLRRSRVAGISAGDPTATKPAGASEGGVLDSARAGGGQAAAQIILPEHERAVRRYFEREKK